MLGQIIISKLNFSLLITCVLDLVKRNSVMINHGNELRDHPQSS